MAVPKRKTSKARRDKRRAQHKIASPVVATCGVCSAPKLPHRVCPSCGTYRGKRYIVDNAPIA
jgi:large subunit ribosomal protein L32